MHIPTIETQIKYITNAAGEKTEVIVPVELWQTLMELIQPVVSGLHPIDENEPKASILEDLKVSLKQSEAGQTYPLSELWDDIGD